MLKLPETEDPEEAALNEALAREILARSWKVYKKAIRNNHSIRDAVSLIYLAGLQSGILAMHRVKTDAGDP